MKQTLLLFLITGVLLLSACSATAVLPSDETPYSIPPSEQATPDETILTPTGTGETESEPESPHTNDGLSEQRPGSGFFMDSGQSLGRYRDYPGCFSYSVFLGDLDGDSDLDAFIANWNQPNKVFFNDGHGTFIDSGQELGDSMSIDVFLGDVDSDDDLDAFVINPMDEHSRVWINDGNGNFTDRSQHFNTNDSHSVFLGDVDGDNDLDAFVAYGGFYYLEQPDRVYLNDGDGNYTDSGQTLGHSSSQGVFLGDVDGDNDLDAFIAGGNTVWLNDGNGNFTDSGQLISGEFSTAVFLGDVDGDNDLDAFIAQRGVNKVWLNDGKGNFTDSGQSLGDSTSEDVFPGDLDGDNDLDAFVANHGPNKVWLNDGKGNFVDSGQSLGNCFSDAIFLGDFDGDHDLDAYVANGGSGTYESNKVWFNVDPESDSIEASAKE